MKKEQTGDDGKMVISYDAEKLKALKHYAAQRNVDVSQVLTETLDRLFSRCVPQSVQAYLEIAREIQNSNQGG